MRESTTDRAVALGEYIIETGATVRAAAKVFSVSKSTVHKDVTERLSKDNPQLYRCVKKILEKLKIGKELIETYGAENTAVLDWLKTDKRLGIENIEIDLTTPNLIDYNDYQSNETFTEEQNSGSLL